MLELNNFIHYCFSMKYKVNADIFIGVWFSNGKHQMGFEAVKNGKFLVQNLNGVWKPKFRDNRLFQFQMITVLLKIKLS